MDQTSGPTDPNCDSRLPDKVETAGKRAAETQRPTANVQCAAGADPRREAFLLTHVYLGIAERKRG